MQRLASLDQIPEGQGNSLKGINKRAGRREGASFILFISKKNLNGNHIWPTLLVKSGFCLKLKLFNVRKKMLLKLLSMSV